MSVTIDANVLLYASDSTSPRNATAVELLHNLVRGPHLLYVFWPVVMAYLRISTHPSVFTRPLAPGAAHQNISNLLEQPLVRSAGESADFWSAFRSVTRSVVARGNLVPDAHIAALMRQHAVTVIWTGDRDFRRFEGVTARDPFS